MKSLIIGFFCFCTYVAGAMVPLEWLWFDPGTPEFQNAVVGSDPQLIFVRDIKTNVAMSYAVILRNAADKDVVCDAVGGPFTYLPERSGALVGKGLKWFAPSDARCSSLPVGTYYGEVTWTAAYPLRAYLPGFLGGLLGWIVPSKSVTRDIAPFEITAYGE